MSGYTQNVALWLTGFGRFDEIRFKQGWKGKSVSWILLYLIDYGFNVVILANPVVSISRYCYIRRSSQPWKWLGEMLDKWHPRHIENAGDPLWDSLPNPHWQRIVVPLGWLLILWAVL